MPPVNPFGIFIGTDSVTDFKEIKALCQQRRGQWVLALKANYIINTLWIISFSIAIVIISYITSMLITYSIRKNISI